MAMNLKSHNPSFGEEALQCIALSVRLVYVSVLRADVASLIYVLLLLALSCLGSVCFFALLNSKKITEHSPEFEWDPMTKYSLHCNWVPFKREK